MKVVVKLLFGLCASRPVLVFGKSDVGSGGDCVNSEVFEGEHRGVFLWWLSLIIIHD